MGHAINSSSRNPQPSYWQQVKAAYAETFGPIFSDDSKKTESKDEKKTKESHDKAVQQTIRARYHNNDEMLPRSQGNASFSQDTVAFSPEALAMRG
jgi:hypothetical protein